MVDSSQFKGLEFYENLAKLFYAIASVDKTIRDEEFLRLKDLVRQGFLTATIKDDQNRNEAESLLINTFNWLRIDNEYGSEVCYNSFIRFKNEHKQLFNKQTCTLILKTGAQIASSFSGTNKAELIMLAKLDIEFKKHLNEE